MFISVLPPGLKRGGIWTAFKLLVCALYISLRVYCHLMSTPGKKVGAPGKKRGAALPFPPPPPLGFWGNTIYLLQVSKITSVYIYSTCVHKLIVPHLLSCLLYPYSQKGGLAAKWERTFFFTKNGYLYTQSLQKVSLLF